MKKRIEHKDGKKYCHKCKIWKDLDKFSNVYYTWDKLYSYCKECKSKECKEYRLNYPERWKKKRDKWKKDNPMKIKYYAYKQRGFTMTYNTWLEIATQPCTYCGKIDLPCNGIDRINNTKGYIKGNCAPCCKKCNYMKRDMLKEEFIMKCKEIVEKQEMK